MKVEDTKENVNHSLRKQVIKGNENGNNKTTEETMKDWERVTKRLEKLIKAAHGENDDFVYIPVATAKLIIKLISSQEENRLIRNRSEQWEKSEAARASLLESIRFARRIEKLFQTDELSMLIFFALDQLPIAETFYRHGEVTEEYADFIRRIPEMGLQEMYDKAIQKGTDGND